MSWFRTPDGNQVWSALFWGWDHVGVWLKQGMLRHQIHLRIGFKPDMTMENHHVQWENSL